MNESVTLTQYEWMPGFMLDRPVPHRSICLAMNKDMTHCTIKYTSFNHNDPVFEGTLQDGVVWLTDNVKHHELLSNTLREIIRINKRISDE